MTIKLTLVAGARPNFIKLSPVINNIIKRQKNGEKIAYSIIHTGQHYDKNMSSVFFEEMGIPSPNYQLAIGSGTHSVQTGLMMIEIEKILQIEKPDYVIAIGDTNSTIAAALAAAKLKIPVAHIEAGLRSFDKRIPEEINRIVCDHISSLLFPPTLVGYNNLIREGIPKENVFNFGDVMYDAVIEHKRKIEIQKLLADLKLKQGQYILVTIHRAENTDNLKNLESILKFISGLATKTPLLFPIHPRTKKIIDDVPYLKKITENDNIKMIAPLSYAMLLGAIQESSFVMTDSGGLQKEAYFFAKKCLNIFHSTPWPELHDNGWLTLCPPDHVEHMNEKLQEMFKKEVQNVSNLYGKGNAAELIIEKIIYRITNGI